MSEIDGVIQIEEQISAPHSDMEIDPNLVSVVRDTDPLWGDAGSRVESLSTQGTQTKNLAHTADCYCDACRIVKAILIQKTGRRAFPFYPVAGDTNARTRLTDAFDVAGKWVLARINFWADPGASADLVIALTVNTGGLASGIPFKITASRADITSREIYIPIIDVVDFAWTVTGGAGTDHAAVIAVFERSE